MTRVNDDDVLRLVDRANAADEAAAHSLERAFTCSQQLVVYGTLAPGEPNHHQLAACPGTWARAAVRGRRAMRQFPVFTYDAAAPLVPVLWLTSASLPPHWARLDAFEGPDYRRILVPVWLGEQWVNVAHLYAAVAPVPSHR